MEALKKAFLADAFNCIKKCRKIGYNPRRFENMLHDYEYDAVALAKRLIAKDDINMSNPGLIKLSQIGGLKWSSEARALRPEFRPLFTEEELRKAEEILTYHQFDFIYDDLEL